MLLVNLGIQVREVGANPPKFKYIQNTSDFAEMWTIEVNLHEKHNESNLNFLGGHVGGLWGAAPLKI